MVDAQIASLLLVALVLLIGLRVPIGAALISVSFCGIWILFGWRPAIGALRGIPYNFAANWQLSAVPMFLFMGFLAYNTGITSGLFRAARVWLSSLPGGLAIASVFGASGFASVTGSSVACAAAMGRIAVPEMLRSGYAPGLATGAVAAAGTIGALIPPSIILIVYGIVAQVPVGDLFLGGVVVGMLTAASYILVVLLWAMIQPSVAPRVKNDMPLAERFRVLLEISPVLILAVLIIGGLLFGLFTPTEAGAVGAALCVVIAFFSRSLTWHSLRKTVSETLITTSSIFIIAIGANLLARFVTLSGVDIYLSTAIMQVADNQIVLLLGIVVLYLILGMFLDPIGAMLLTLPILLPIARAVDVNLLWFGIFVTKLLEMGMVTPPIGLNVFVIKSVVGAQIKLATIFRGVMWFFAADLIVVGLLILFPSMITSLPAMFN